MQQTLSFDAPQIRAASLQLSHFVHWMAAETARELGFGWRPAVLAPVSIDEARREFRSSHHTGLPVRVSYADAGQTVFATPSATWASRFWNLSRHVWLGADFDHDGQLEVASCQLKRLTMAGFGTDSMEYRLLLADTVGRAR